MLRKLRLRQKNGFLIKKRVFDFQIFSISIFCQSKVVFYFNNCRSVKFLSSNQRVWNKRKY